MFRGDGFGQEQEILVPRRVDQRKICQSGTKSCSWARRRKKYIVAQEQDTVPRRRRRRDAEQNIVPFFNSLGGATGQSVIFVSGR